MVPTRGRPDYLDVALSSVCGQAGRAGAEVIVVLDGPDPDSEAVALRHGGRVISLPAPRGLNAARNAGADAARSDLVVLLDDDVDAPAGWLEALLAGVRAAPGHGVFGGPIAARLEGGGPRACGREPAPITTLDLGSEDHDARRVWGANMAIRRSALELAGRFDESMAGRGDEEEWEERYVAAGGRIRYVAGAAVDHRRTQADARLRALVRADFHHGRSARRSDARRGAAPSLTAELRTLAGCAWHVVRRRCAIGVVMLAHTAGRIVEALAGRP